MVFTHIYLQQVDPTTYRPSRKEPNKEEIKQGKNLSPKFDQT